MSIDSERAPTESPLLAELRRHLTGPHIQAEQARILADTVVEAILGDQDDADDVTYPLACEDCQEMFDICLAEEMQGGHLEQSYPHLWGHLQGCQDCRKQYEVLRLTFFGEPSPVPEAKPQAWVRTEQSVTQQERFWVAYAATLDYLRQTFFPDSMPMRVATRKGKDPYLTSRMILDDYDILVGEQQFELEVSAKKTPQAPDRVALEALISSSDDLPPTLQVRVTWAGQTQLVAVPPDGAVALGDFSLQALEAALAAGAGGLEIRLETGETPGQAAG